MPIVFVYPEMRDYTREVEEYINDYGKRVNKEIQTVDPESREGTDFCRVYDITEYPSVVALAQNGSVLKLWKGRPLPLMDEVSYYDQGD